MLEEDDGIILEIPQGKLCGKREIGILGNVYYSFQRIPYAKQPVGELRFKPPQPADGWIGLRDARVEGTVCPSLDITKTKYLPNSDEGSLYLNVFCKHNPTESSFNSSPVLVFIHGGGFDLGSGNRDKCGPDFFMLYDIVLVTFNYRIGALGFLSLQTVECPGNFGLKDQKLAFVWVRNNISYFGGDPDNVTIFGLSSGGACVQYHTLDMSSKGLFQKVISQSGSPVNHWAYSRNPRKNAFLLGKRLGCDTQDDKTLLEFLRKTSAEDIVLKSERILDETEGVFYGDNFVSFSFVPTKEPEHPGAIITKHPWVLLEQGKFLDIPCITGITDREMVVGVKNKEDFPKFTNDEEYENLIPKDIAVERRSARSREIGRRLKSFYFKDGISLYNYIDYLSDTFINYGVYKTVKMRGTFRHFKSPTYLYNFSYHGEQQHLKQILGIGDIKGAAHADDLNYLFKTDLTNTVSMVSDSRDYKVMRNMTKLWVKFATDGVPDLTDPPIRWIETNPTDLFYLNLNESFEMKRNLKKNRLEFWDELYSSFYKEAELDE